MSEKLLQIRRTVGGVFMDSEVHLCFTINKNETNDIIPVYASYDREEENSNLQNNEVFNKITKVCEILGLMHIKKEVLEALSEMRENDIGDGREQTKEIVVPPKEKLKPHSSCKMNQNVVSNSQAKTETRVSQSELKLKLSFLEKDSKIMKTFEGNICSVCLSNYKEILDEHLHIVIPSCGHPLCCKCADYILDSKKKECPQCRERVTAQSFNLMKFNADLEIDTENQRVFL